MDAIQDGKVENLVRALMRSVDRLESDPNFVETTDVRQACYHAAAGTIDLDDLCDAVVYCIAIYGAPVLQNLDAQSLYSLIFEGEHSDDAFPMQAIIANDIRNQILEQNKPVDRIDAWEFMTPSKRFLIAVGLPFNLFVCLCEYAEPVSVFLLLFALSLRIQHILRTILGVDSREP